MIYFPNSAVFEKLADLLDPMYSILEEEGHDLAEMEAIHITRSVTGAGDMTLIFDTLTMPTRTFAFKKDGKVAAILDAK